MSSVLILSEDGNIGVAIFPSPSDTSVVLLAVVFYDLELPVIPVPVKELRAALEVWFGKV